MKTRRQKPGYELSKNSAIYRPTGACTASGITSTAAAAPCSLTRSIHKDCNSKSDLERPLAPSDGVKQKKHKTVFCKLKHNDLYLKDIPKSSYYLIFELQNELVQHGHLQTHHKLEDFYKSIQYNRCPSKLQRSLVDIKMKMLDKRPAITVTAASGSSQLCTEETDTASDSRLAERGSESGQCVSEEAFGGSLKKDEFEQMFPKVSVKTTAAVIPFNKRVYTPGALTHQLPTNQHMVFYESSMPTQMKMPTFLTLQPNFMRSFECTLPQSISLEIPKKSRKTDMYLKQIKDMYKLCLTNMKFSQSFKLLDQTIDSESWLMKENQKIPDLTFPDIDSHKKSTQSPTFSQQLSVHSNPPPSAQDKFDQVEDNVQSLESKLLYNVKLHSASPVPLCMEDVYEQKHVKVIGCGLKLWKNYTVVSE
ncbi:uncharacterized protein si:ch211-130h14.4 isoform X3 [Periophthalmus magnuspinnatus]|nr:uncharacterized protein si:ch211-130h14.4 isoform X3 [Periophthalmus magnuspinnatus]